MALPTIVLTNRRHMNIDFFIKELAEALKAPSLQSAPPLSRKFK